jgi:hypothetical protein
MPKRVIDRVFLRYPRPVPEREDVIQRDRINKWAKLTATSSVYGHRKGLRGTKRLAQR